MTTPIPLSTLAALVQQTVETVFEHEPFWVVAEVTDVKKTPDRRWCFLKFVEKDNNVVVADMQGVIWPQAWPQIALFERITGKRFESGLQVACRVIVRFHPRFGLKLDVQEIDASYTIGQLELDKQHTLEKLLRTYPQHIRLEHDSYISANQQLKQPRVLQRIALIGAAGSDGVRDFTQELLHNAYGYQFQLQVFSASVQGQYAVPEICEQLDHLHHIASSFDCIALVRGGGSHTDFAAFDDFEVARRIALFPIPVLTGIGHDRNISIADMMGWMHKTPTKVAAAIVDTALRFDSDVQQLAERLQDATDARLLDVRQALQQYAHLLQLRVPHRLQMRRQQLLHWRLQTQQLTDHRLLHYQHQLRQQQAHLQATTRLRLQQQQLRLQHMARLVNQLSPEQILQRGFAMVLQQGKLLTDASQLNAQLPMTTLLRQHYITSDIKSITDAEGKNI